MSRKLFLAAGVCALIALLPLAGCQIENGPKNEPLVGTPVQDSEIEQIESALNRTGPIGPDDVVDFPLISWNDDRGKEMVVTFALQAGIDEERAANPHTWTLSESQAVLDLFHADLEARRQANSNSMDRDNSHEKIITETYWWDDALGTYVKSTGEARN